MGELWRSQEMQLVQLFIQVEAAHDTVDELGKLGLVEFRDLNPHINAFQRNFINEVKRADEMQRKLRFFGDQIEDHNASVGASGKVIKLTESKDEIIAKSHTDELEARFEDYEKQLLEMNSHQQALHRNRNQLVELHHVLEKDAAFFHRVGDQIDESQLEEGQTAARGLGFITGVIAREKFALFERVLFRSTRGNIYIQYGEIKEDIEDTSAFGKMIKKNVFIVFFHGSALQAKIKKICESFNANLYPCPDTTTERKNLSDQVRLRLEELKVLLSRGEAQRAQLLGIIALSLNSWMAKVKQEKGIYHTMNKFNYDLGRRCLIAEGWIPSGSADDVVRCLRIGNERSGAQVPSIMNPIEAKEEPPTYFKINKYTAAFQGMINSYGIARYREINPAVFTIVTFPWEFGIMFGDVGHGILLLLFASLLIYKERDWEGKKINEMIEMFYAGRYLIFLMALFSIYQGFLYNEFFSLPMNFGSVWIFQDNPNTTNNTFKIPDYPNDSGVHKQYVFGADPVWKGASNELLYYNSVKMKMSVIIGVIQMSLGIFLHLLNALHFKHWLDVFGEFIPRIVFLWCIFGYLCFMIFFKWGTDYAYQDVQIKNLLAQHPNATIPEHWKGTQKAPVLLNEMIFMILPGGAPDNLFSGQKSLQTALVVIAVLMIPIMMCLKPFHFKCCRKRDEPKYVNKVQVSHDEEESESERYTELGGNGHGGGHGEDFSELMVHQILETIEFVLGSVSHTASYLRLWALSLAHSELATVFWEKVVFLLMSYTVGVNWFVVGLGMFAAHSIWFFVTFLVMMFMEGLSAFLHALRLHWVEFQSKFYKGDGHEFQPFSYAALDQPKND
jgi:V-type H+-transporting ATPase subunit a